MDNLIYNISGYKTNYLLNTSAKKIQNAYKNHKSYQINRRIDIIRNRIPKKEITELDMNQEIIYWNNLRNIIKSEKDWFLV